MVKKSKVKFVQKIERWVFNIYIKIKEIEIFGLNLPYTLKIFWYDDPKNNKYHLVSKFCAYLSTDERADVRVE